MVSTPVYNPDTHCIRCCRAYRPTDEYCTSCGFNPVDCEEDDNENEIAKHLWRVKEGIER